MVLGGPGGGLGGGGGSELDGGLEEEASGVCVEIKRVCWI